MAPQSPPIRDPHSVSSFDKISGPYALRGLLWTLAATYIAVFGIVFVKTLVLVPFSDMVEWLEQYAAFKRNGDFLNYLLLPHNEHRLVLIRLLTMADVELFGSHGIVFFAAGVASLVGIFILAWRAVARFGEPTLGPVAMIVAAIVFTAPNGSDCSIPIFANYPITVFFVILSFNLMANSVSPRPGLALVAAICGALTNAVGILALPLLLWLAWRARVNWLWLAVLFAATLFFFAVFIADAQRGDEAAANLIIHAVGYFASFVGLPWSRAPSLVPLSRTAGIALCFLSLALSISRLRSLSDLDAQAVALVLFSLGCAAFAALGRSGLVEPFIPVRYAVFMTPLHLGLLFLVLRFRIISERIGVVALGLFNVQQVFASLAALHIGARF
jgi:hypothetical protein